MSKKKKYTNLGLAYVAEQLLLQDEPQYAAIVDRGAKLLEKARDLRHVEVRKFAGHPCAGPRVGLVMTEEQYKKFEKLLDKIETFLDSDEPV